MRFPALKMQAKGTKKNKKIDVKEVEIIKLKAQLIRALADYDNLRKRFDTEIENKVKMASAMFTIKFLTIFDMLKNAQNHLKDAGIAIVLEEFGVTLKAEGVSTIGTKKGDTFDEKLHEAVEVSQKSGKKDGEIDKIVLSGWKINDMVIRPTKVKVFRKINN